MAHRGPLVVYNPDEEEPKPHSVYDKVPPPPPLPSSYPGSPPPLNIHYAQPVQYSNPALSSPSSTSSRAFESTPPPSTPGAAQPPVDLAGDALASPESHHVHSAQDHHTSHPQRSGKNIFKIIFTNGSSSSKDKDRLKHPRRPQTSPTVSTSESYSSAGSGERVLIAVTTDWEKYMSVDLTGMRSADFIKERILSKLQVSDEDQNNSTFAFHKTEFGGQTYGEPLSDARLFDLCRDHGDSKGRLCLFVSVTHTMSVDRDGIFTAMAGKLNPTAPPPFLGSTRPSPVPPMTRQDSVSSTSEPHPDEPNGYEGDVDVDTHPSAHRQLRPLPQPNQCPSSSPPREIRRPPLPSSPKAYPPRSLSPPVVSQPQDRSRYTTTKYGQYNTPQPPTPSQVPPPLSPSRSSFPPNDRSGPIPNYATVQRLQIPERDALHSPPSTHLPLRPPDSSHPTLRHQPSRDMGPSNRRPRRGLSETEETARVADLRMQEKERLMQQQEGTRISTLSRNRISHVSPVRTRNNGLSNHPANPPPPVPTSTAESRPRGAAAVPANWPVMWKGDNRTRGQAVHPTPRERHHQLNKYKSEDSLRHVARSTSHPVTLQPGGRLPLGGNANSTSTAGDGAARGMAANGLPKSESKMKNLLPMQGPQTYARDRQPSSNAVSPGTNGSFGRFNPSSFGENGTLLAGRIPSNIRPSSSGMGSMLSPNGHDTYMHSSSSYDLPSLSRSPGGSPHSPSRHSLEPYDSGDQSSTISPDSSLNAELDKHITFWAGEQGASTIIQPYGTSANIGTNMTTSTNMTNMTDSSSEFWKVQPTNGTLIPTSQTRPKLEVDTTRNSHHDPNKHFNFDASSDEPSSDDARLERPMRGTFSQNSWAPRPPAEVVYDRLEDFFSSHDLDKPVVEASSGGTSPTLVEPTVTPDPPSDREARARAKKSIRVVAKEHQRRVRDSRTDAAYSMYRKRSTKLWGSKVEEITPLQAKTALMIPESPTGGTTTFKWVRGELIGRGTYGKVYLALNATTGEMIAVKQVELPSTPSDKSDSRQAAVVQALKMESQTLKDLDHPNIVSYLGFEETPQNLSIFLEYVPGGSIGSCLVKHGRFDEEVTKSFTYQILSGLEYLHSKGILHRDMKADNVLVETSGICKISDFGISKRTDDLGAHTAMQGTVFWMAPEVVNTRKGRYNSKIDIWSVGCVVLEMWGGRRPWMGEEMVAVMFKLYNERLPPPIPDDVHLSPLADDLRQKCFAIDPDERPTAAELKNHPYLKLAPGWVFTGFK